MNIETGKIKKYVYLKISKIFDGISPVDYFRFVFSMIL